jgi:hypothetical protein
MVSGWMVKGKGNAETNTEILRFAQNDDAKWKAERAISAPMFAFRFAGVWGCALHFFEREFCEYTYENSRVSG